jgi:hypothetical protein
MTVSETEGSAARWHSTRLFPKFRGADACRLTGIAARCDWVVLSDARPPHVALVRHRARPRHVFLSMRAPFEALRFLAEEVLPQIQDPFVLVSGSEDATLPRQTDQRWRPFDTRERALIAGILADARLLQWFAENLDEAWHPRLSPLPVGLVWPDGPPEGPWPYPPGVGPAPLGPRPLRVLVAHRHRDGPQWELRRKVGALAREAWSEFTTVVEEEVPQAEFVALMSGHSFVLCAEGGGLDPSPKAWTALLCGAIPIIRDTPVAAAYRALPMVVLPDWSAQALHPARLAAWKAALQPDFDRPERRGAVLQRLTLDHWWQRICAACRADDQPRKRDGAAEAAP